MSVIIEHPLATKSTKAYLALRRMIVTGEIASGVPLKIPEMMEITGLGRTPLREGLKRLANEGLVVWTEQRSPFVHENHPHELDDLTEARIAVEVPAARLAAKRMSIGQMKELRRITQDMAGHRNAGEYYELTELDFQFHTQLARFSGNRFLFEAVSALNAGALRMWYRASSTIGSLDDAHDIILEALEARDEAGAGDAIKDHILTFRQRQLDAGQRKRNVA